MRRVLTTVSFFFYLAMSSTYFTEVRTDLHQEAIRPSGSSCFSRGVLTNLLPLVIFQAVGANLLSPLWSSETSLGPSQVRLWAWKGPEGGKGPDAPYPWKITSGYRFSGFTCWISFAPVFSFIIYL